jgi:hypothetical protein
MNEWTEQRGRDTEMTDDNNDNMAARGQGGKRGVEEGGGDEF